MPLRFRLWPAFHSAVLAAASVAAVLAQTPSETVAIAGHVVDPTTGRSVPGATVHLFAVDQHGGRVSAARTTTSDSSGSFVFDDVEPGDYSLDAENEAGLGRYGARRPNGRSRILHVRPGARVEDVTIRLWPLGTIEGRVTDERGHPLDGINVQLEPSESRTSTWIKTGPDGHYRARHVLPGKYIAVVDSWLFNLPVEPDPPKASVGRPGGYPFLIDIDRRTVMFGALPFPANADEGRRRMFVTSVHSKRGASPAEPIRVTGAEVQRGIDLIVHASTVFGSPGSSPRPPDQ